MMPDYEFTDPERGLTLTVTGPTPPPKAVLDRLFHDAAMKTARIGPVTPQDTTPVTLGDLIDNPKLAVQRMVSITKQAMSDPRVMIPAVVGLGLGGLARAADRMPSMPSMPNPMNAVRSAAGRLAGTNPEAVADAVGILSPRTGAAVRTAARVAGKLAPKPADVPLPPPGAAPAPVATPGAPATPAPTIAPPEPVVAPSRPAPAPKAPRVAKTRGEESGDLPSLDEIQLTPAEIATAVKWHEQGVSPETILHRVLQSRQLTARTRTTTPDQAAAAVRRRNETGRWED